MLNPMLGNETAVMRPANGSGAWDYAVVSLHARHCDMLEAQLKERGNERWELVYMHVPSPNEYVCVFRRPVLN